MSFYSRGLRFTCLQCSSCCRFDPGFVFLSEKDVEALATKLGIGYSDFIGVHCRWIPAGNGIEQLSLKERSNYDCIFWKDGCTVYGSRPLQCRTFPFWTSVLVSRESWQAVSEGCPGMGSGALHDAAEIEAASDLRLSEPVITRRVR